MWQEKRMELKDSAEKLIFIGYFDVFCPPEQSVCCGFLSCRSTSWNGHQRGPVVHSR